MINWLNRKPLKPFVPFKTYNISEGDPQRMFVDIIVKEMEGRIESILEKKEQEAAEAKSPRFIKESGVYLPSQPDYLWLMDCKLKERKNLSIQEYLSVEKLIEKTTMCEWGIVIDLWEKELESVKTRAEVIKSFEDVIQSILNRRDEKKLSFSSADDVVISMSQLLSNEEQETKNESDCCSTKTTETVISVETLRTTDEISIQLLPDAKDKYKRVLDIV